MSTEREPLGEAAAALREGRREATGYVADLYDRIEAVEDDVRAWVGGPKPRAQLEAEAAALEARYPDPDRRPPLFGVPVGVKDIFHVDGLPTKAGATIPPGEVVGPESESVSRLVEAGALVAGKTVTTEFAYFDPGPTRNPHDLDHTPGGSSSGSAAAVAAGMVPLALGSQTAGSVTRPASFCGVVGYKPSFERIPYDTVLHVSPTLDHVGTFAQDVDGTELAASVLVDDWDPVTDVDRPTLGVPDGAYLEQAEDAGQEAFERTVGALEDAGYEVRRFEVFEDVERLNERHLTLMAAEAAMTHQDWFERFGDEYAPEMAALIEDGRDASVGDLAAVREFPERLRAAVKERMDDHGVDLVVSPGAPGPAPEGIDDTGDPVMNVPWTTSGQPTVTLPTGHVDGLPVGLQVAARFGADERLLAWADSLADDVAGTV